MSRTLCSVIAMAALSATSVSAKDYAAPRLPDGIPDLQGVWTGRSSAAASSAAASSAAASSAAGE